MSEAAAPASRDAAALDSLCELLARGRKVTLRARGGSMWPWLRDGDVLTLAPLSGLPRRGEVVAARCRFAGAAGAPPAAETGAPPAAAGGAPPAAAAGLVVHRVLRASPAGVVLRGDALTEPDATLAPEAVVGLVVAVRPAASTQAPGASSAPDRASSGSAPPRFLPLLLGPLTRTLVRLRRRARGRAAALP